MANEHTLVIIWNGVAANVLGFYLRRDAATQTEPKIIQISHDAVYRPCSQLTTSHICLRNTRKSVSLLGDLLVDAFGEFCAFYERHAPAGVYACDHFHLWCRHSDRAAGLFRRYEGVTFSGDKIDSFADRFARQYEMAKNPAFVVDPGRYLSFLVHHSRYDSVINEAVVAVKKDTVRLVSGREVFFDRLFLCTGQFTHAFSETFQDPHHLNHSKPVAGTYLEFDLSDFRREELCDARRAFCLDVEEVNLVFRPEDQVDFLDIQTKRPSGIAEFLPPEIGQVKLQISPCHRFRVIEVMGVLKRLGEGMRKLSGTEKETIKEHFSAGHQPDSVLLDGHHRFVDHAVIAAMVDEETEIAAWIHNKSRVLGHLILPREPIGKRVDLVPTEGDPLVSSEESRRPV